MHWEIWCEKDAAFRHSKVAAYGHKSQHKTNIPNLKRTVAKNCKYWVPIVFICHYYSKYVALQQLAKRKQSSASIPFSSSHLPS